MQLDVGTSGIASTFVVQAMDISQEPANSEEGSAKLMYLLESTIISTVKWNWANNKEIKSWLYHDHN